MAKKKRSRRPTPPPDPLQEILDEMVGNVKKLAVDKLREIVQPTPDFFKLIKEPLHNNNIKDAEVIAIRKG